MIALPETTSDAEWRAWLRHGSHRDFDAAVAPWLELLQRIARRLLGPSLLADDAVQEGLLQVVRRRSELDPSISCETALASAVYYRGLTLGRAEGRRRRHETEAGRRWVRRSDRPQAAADLTALLSALDTEQRQVLQRRYLDGEPIGSIAGNLGLSANACTVRLHRARMELRQLVQ